MADVPTLQRPDNPRLLRAVARWIQGDSIRKAAKAEGVGRVSITRYLRSHPEAVASRPKATQEVQERAADLLALAFDQLEEGLQEGAFKASQLPVVAGILADKVLNAQRILDQAAAPQEQPGRSAVERLLDAISSGGGTLAVQVQGSGAAQAPQVAPGAENGGTLALPQELESEMAVLEADVVESTQDT
jgi:hypothetical protein